MLLANLTFSMSFASFATLQSQKEEGSKRPLKTAEDYPKIRSLAARRDPEIAIEVTLADAAGEPPIWRYALGLRQETRGYRQPSFTYERVWKGKSQILDRPQKEDEQDRDRLTQTFLEQINVNVEFRDIVRFFQAVTYLHLVPQLLRFADSIQGRLLEDDPFGQGFLERVLLKRMRKPGGRVFQRCRKH